MMGVGWHVCISVRGVRGVWRRRVDWRPSALEQERYELVDRILGSRIVVNLPLRSCCDVSDYRLQEEDVFLMRPQNMTNSHYQS